MSNVFFGETGPIREPAGVSTPRDDDQEERESTDKTLVGTSA